MMLRRVCVVIPSVLFLLGIVPLVAQKAALDYSTPLGFVLSYSAEWQGTSLGALVRAEQLPLDAASLHDPVRRSIECEQNLFTAHRGEPRSTFVMGAITAECTGTQANLELYAQRVAARLMERYRPLEMRPGFANVNGHPLWMLRARVAAQARGGLPLFIEYVAMETPLGLVCWRLEASDRASLASFEQMRLRFGEGSVPLFPAEFFAEPTAVTTQKQREPLHGAAQDAASRPTSLPQAAAAEPTRLSAPGDYSTEPFVVEELTHRYAMQADGTGSLTVATRVRVQSDAAVRQLGMVKVGFASRSEHVEFAYVRVRHGDGSVTESSTDEAFDMPTPVTTESPLYSDQKEMQVPVRSLHVGDVLEWQATVVRSKAEAPDSFWSAEAPVKDVVVLRQTTELRVPASVALKLWSPVQEPRVTEEGGTRVYRWEFKQLQPTVGALAEAWKEYRKHHVMSEDEQLDAREGELPAIAWSTFSDWQQVGAWYQKLSGDRIDSTHPAIVKKAAELVAGKKTDEEKLQALYNYVATQIRYIGVDFGVGRYRPHTASDVLENQYGDCKDKHALLAALLRTQGIAADAVLAGSGIRFNQALPSPQSFNHVFTHVVLHGHTYWLDATPEVAPFGMLSASLRDRTVLVIPTSGAAVQMRTPDALPFAQFDRMQSVGTLDAAGNIHAQIDMALRGDTELELRGAFHQTTSAQYDQLLQQFLRGIGYGGSSSHLELSKITDSSEPFHLSFAYQREKPGDWEHLQIVPELLPVTLPRPQESEPPVRDLELGPVRVEEARSKLVLPVGWQAKLPPDQHLSSPWVRYDVSYHFADGAVFAERRVEVLSERVPQAMWRAYKKMADEADFGSDPYVRLMRPSRQR